MISFGTAGPPPNLHRCPPASIKGAKESDLFRDKVDNSNCRSPAITVGGRLRGDKAERDFTMTSQRDLKERIRARMASTGERYATARSHILSQRDLAREFGGTQPDIAPLRALLGAVGVKGPDDRPVAEHLVFGLTGGVGFMYGVFEWDTGPTFTLLPRLHSTPDPLIEPIFKRLGVSATFHETGGAKTAVKQLDSVLTDGTHALISVGAGHLDHLGLDLAMSSMLPRVVGVIGASGGEVLVSDLAPEPVPLARPDVDAARSAIRKAKHRMITVTDAPPIEWNTAILDAVRATAQGYDTPPVPQFASNVGRRGLAKWRDMLTDTGPRGWPHLFGTDGHAMTGLLRTYEGITSEYTSSEASRPMYAAFLKDAAAVLSDDRLTEAAALFESASAEWRAISDLIASSDPVVAEAVGLIDEITELIGSGAPGSTVRAKRADLEHLLSTARVAAHLAAETYAAMSVPVGRILELETTAIEVLATV